MLQVECTDSNERIKPDTVLEMREAYGPDFVQTLGGDALDEIMQFEDLGLAILDPITIETEDAG